MKIRRSGYQEAIQLTSFRFQLLGGFQIADDNGIITDIPGKKVRLLLAYLVLHADAPQSRRQIAFDFWPDSTEKQALSNLRKLIHDLRESLPHIEPYLNISSLFIQWNNDLPYYLDVREFEQAAKAPTLHELQQAEMLYRGELMPGFYEEWLRSERDLLAQMFMKTQERLVFLLEIQRDYASAIYMAQKLLVHNRLNETYYRTLMRLYALNKDTAGVRTTYEKLCSHMEEEFGAAPDEETLYLYNRLTQCRTEEADVAPDTSGQTSLVGRIDEWGIALRVWNQAIAGRPQLLLLKGEAGIGKTRLALEFKTWVERQGISTAFTGCYPSVRSLSYTPVINWLRSFPLPQMNSSGLSELARLLPELHEKYPDLPVPGPIQENWQLSRWYDAIERMLFSDLPLLLILDDIHWSDSETIQFLSYLLRSDSGAKLLIIATMRTEQSVDESVARMITDIQLERKLTEIELAPLNKEDTQYLMAATVGDAFADKRLPDLYAMTGGNPLFIVETLKEWQIGSDGDRFHFSPVVRNAITNRLNRYPESQSLLNAVAAIGRPVTTSLIALVLELNEDIIDQQTERLIQLKVMHVTESGKYDFTHELIRIIAYETMNDKERRYFHGQIARAIIAIHNRKPETIAAEIAFHFELAGMEHEALPYYEIAVLEAEKLFAYETVIYYCKKICALLTPDQVWPYLLKIGESWIMLGNWNEAERTYGQWLECRGYSAPIRDRSFCDVALGNCLLLQGKYEEARFHLERSLRHFEIMEDSSGCSLAYGTVGILHYCWGNYAESLSYLMARRELPNAEKRIHEECRFSIYIGFLYYDQCEYDEAIRWFKKQIKLAASRNDSRAITVAMGGLTLTYLDMDELNLAYDYIAEKMEISKSIGDRMEFAVAVGMLGKYYLYHGHRSYATQCIAYCLEEAIIVKDWRIAAIVIGLEGRNLMEQQRHEEAKPLLERSLRMFRKLRILYFTCETLYFLCILRHQQNQLAGALEAAEEASELAARLNRKDMQFMLALQLIRLRTDAGRLSPAGAWSELQKLLDQYSGEREKAAVRYEMWKLDTSSEEFRSEAESLNEALYRKSHKQQYLDRCHELNRFIHPTAARPIPKLAVEVTRSKRITSRLWGEIDRYLDN